MRFTEQIKTSTCSLKEHYKLTTQLIEGTFENIQMRGLIMKSGEMHFSITEVCPAFSEKLSILCIISYSLL